MRAVFTITPCTLLSVYLPMAELKVAAAAAVGGEAVAEAGRLLGASSGTGPPQPEAAGSAERSEE